MNQFIPKCASIWGLPPQFSISDMPRSFTQPRDITGQVSATTLSAAADIGARGVKLVLETQNGNVTCDLELYRVDPTAGDTLVKKWTGITRFNAEGLNAGNAELVDLNGNPIKVKVINPVGGWVKVSAVVTY